MHRLMYWSLLYAIGAAALSLPPRHQYPIAFDDSLDVPGNNSLKFCGDPEDYILEVDHINITPESPKRGSNVSIEASGSLLEDVKNGSKVYLDVKVKVGRTWVPLFQEEMDLCAQLESVNETCPIRKGDLVFQRNFTIPEGAPSGTYLARTDAYNDDGDTISCVEATVKF